jgi:hypothetical protein
MSYFYPLTASVNGVLFKARYDDSCNQSLLSPAAVQRLSVPRSVQATHMILLAVLLADGVFSCTFLFSAAPGRLFLGDDDYDVLLGKDWASFVSSYGRSPVPVIDESYCAF